VAPAAGHLVAALAYALAWNAALVAAAALLFARRDFK
jgi:hypothetical protein